jgi:hypothetical protein
VPTSAQPQRVAILWRLAWSDDSVLECCIYRDGPALQLRVESATSLIVCEPFELQPRAVARAQALRESLKRRGWHERTEVGTAAADPGGLEPR